MENDIYQAPMADVRISINEKKSNVKAVLFASLIDIMGSLASSFLLGMGYILYLIINEVSLDEIGVHLKNLKPLSPIGILGTIIGFLISFYGGFYCAKKSLDKIFRNVGIYVLIMCIYCALAGLDMDKIYRSLSLTIANIFVIYAGAFLWVKKFKE